MKVEVEQVEGRRMVIRTRGLELVVDDTVEAGGPGDGWRPAELLMGALGTCMAGTMITFARNSDVTVSNITMEMEDESAQHPERMAKVIVRMNVDTDATERRLRTLERVASRCKITNTLERETEVEFSFSPSPLD